MIICLTVNLFGLACNFTGLQIVGRASFVLSILIICPFIVFIGFASKFLTPDRVFADYPADLGSPNFAILLSVVVWQFSGFDTVSALSGETANPRRSFPIAMLITVLIVTVVYLLPGIAAVSVQPDITQFQSGTFSSVSKLLPYCESGWLSVWISIAGVCSALSLLNVALSCTGRETYASALVGAFPFGSALGRLDTFRGGDPLPLRGIVLMSILTVPFSLFDFALLISWNGPLTVLAQCMQIATFVAIRRGSIAGPKKQEMQDALIPEQTIDQGMLPERADEVIVIEENVAEREELLGEEELENKFTIPGGWFGAGLVCFALAGISLTLLVFSGWGALGGACMLVAGMYCLKGMELLWDRIAGCWRVRDDPVQIEQVPVLVA
jgi:amino acid transporter